MSKEPELDRDFFYNPLSRDKPGASFKPKSVKEIFGGTRDIREALLGKQDEDEDGDEEKGTEG